MLKIEYEIKLNESGRPCIDLPQDYEHNSEDKFFAVELARYYLQTVHSRMDTTKYNQHTIDMTSNAINILGQIGDEMAEIQYNNMKTQGELHLMVDSAYHIQVNSIEERDELPDVNIVYNERIYNRQEGLKVYVMYPYENYDKEKSGLYVLKNGITNENWVKLS